MRDFDGCQRFRAKTKRLPAHPLQRTAQPQVAVASLHILDVAWFSKCVIFLPNSLAGFLVNFAYGSFK